MKFKVITLLLLYSSICIGQYNSKVKFSFVEKHECLDFKKLTDESNIVNNDYAGNNNSPYNCLQSLLSASSKEDIKLIAPNSTDLDIGYFWNMVNKAKDSNSNFLLEYLVKLRIDGKVVYIYAGQFSTTINKNSNLLNGLRKTFLITEENNKFFLSNSIKPTKDVRYFLTYVESSFIDIMLDDRKSDETEDLNKIAQQLYFKDENGIILFSPYILTRVLNTLYYKKLNGNSNEQAKANKLIDAIYLKPDFLKRGYPF